MMKDMMMKTPKNSELFASENEQYKENISW